MSKKPQAVAMEIEVRWWNRLGRRKVRRIGPYPVSSFTITGDQRLIIYPVGWTPAMEKK